MNDGELESIAKDPSSLTAAAQSALATELRRRNLTQETPQVPVGYDEPEFRNLVTIRKFSELQEALLAKGSLESAGIESCLADDNMVRIFVPTFTGGVRLQVRAEDADAATKILNESNLEDPDVGSDPESWQ